MSQSLTKIYLHIIFHIKTTSPAICEEDLTRVHAYIGQLVNEIGCTNIWTDGTHDHVHILCLLSREVTVANLVSGVKRNCSRWIKNVRDAYNKFEWQGGYAAFSVSQSVVYKTLNYIKNQKEHHKKHTFHEEYIEFLKLYNIEYDDRYVLSD